METTREYISIDAFARAYARGTSSHRDALIEAGRIGQGLILKEMEDGITRHESIEDMAHRIKKTQNDVNKLIQTAMAADLLWWEGRDLKGVAWSILRDLRGAAIRDKKTNQWSLCPVFGEQYRDILADAIRLDLTTDQVRERVNGTRSQRKPRRPEKAQRAGTRGSGSGNGWQDSEKTETPPSGTMLSKMAAAATTKDAAEMAVELVQASQEPKKVASLVMAKLERLGLLQGTYA